MQNDKNQKKAVSKIWNLKPYWWANEYLFQTTRLWKELVVLTVKFKKPRSQKKKWEVNKKTVP